MVPSLTENDIALKNFVLESSSETAIWSSLLDWFLDLPSNATDCSNLSTLELCDFEFAVKHTLDESCVFVDLEWFTDQFQLLHYLELRVQFNYNTCDTNSEMRNVFTSGVLKLLDSNESCTYCISRTIEGCITETEFWSVFNHSETLSLHIICAINWHCLELSPAH